MTQATRSNVVEGRHGNRWGRVHWRRVREERREEGGGEGGEEEGEEEEEEGGEEEEEHAEMGFMSRHVSTETLIRK